jgi:hypothetical protein
MVRTSVQAGYGQLSLELRRHRFTALPHTWRLAKRGGLGYMTGFYKLAKKHLHG